MKIRKVLAVVLLFAAVLTNAFYVAPVYARTLDESIPSFGLYCNEPEALKSGEVTFVLTDAELLKSGVGRSKCRYVVGSADTETEFAVPFISSAMNVPAFNVTVNGQKVVGAVWYGGKALSSDSVFDVADTYPPCLDESVTGTLYTVIPDGDTVTVSLSFADKECFVYETSNNVSSSQSADGHYAWTIRNALSNPDYCFFVVGEASKHSFVSSCSYTTETVTCKEFVNGQYDKRSEYYGDVGVSVELLYSLVNGALQSKSGVNCDRLFYDSVNDTRFNAYKFGVPSGAEAVVSYETPISVHCDYGFAPSVYSVEQRALTPCPTKYVVELNGEIPYITEASAAVSQDGAVHRAEAADGFCFAVSSLRRPQSKREHKTVVIACVSAASVVLVCVGAFAVWYFRRRKR